MKSNRISNSRSGATMVIVMMITVICTAVIIGVLFVTSVRVSRAYDLVHLEQAFYLAEAGIERASAWINEKLGTGQETVFTEEIGPGKYVVHIKMDDNSPDSYNVYATGTVHKVSRAITVHGMQFVSWSQFALWYDKESPSGLWITPGEVFSGRVYSRPLMKFSRTGLNTIGSDGKRRGPALFTEKVETYQRRIEYETGAYPTLEKGIDMGVALQSMASVNFDQMRDRASYLETSGKGLLLEGDVTIELNGTTMTIKSTNVADRQAAGKPVVNRTIRGHEINLVYAKNYPTYSYTYYDERGRRQTKRVTESGNISIAAPNGFTGDMSIVAQNDVRIIDHVRYTDNPQTNPDSTDKLGLIAKNNVTVQTVTPAAPNNLEIYAHIFSKEGGFGVENYDTGSFRGDLFVYGGIANDIRRAVGTFATDGTGKRTGYNKQYFFDERFKRQRPMNYPYTRTELTYNEWEG